VEKGRKIKIQLSFLFGVWNKQHNDTTELLYTIVTGTGYVGLDSWDGKSVLLLLGRF